MNRSRMLLSCIAFVAAIGGGFAAVALHPTLSPVPRPADDSFDPTLVEHGKVLAALGNCAGCHTAPGRPSFSGGLPIETPFGTIYSSNITPDARTGIGLWSQAAFRRAMREGVDRRGRNLYPAFPYDHYTLVNDADDDALYAFLMTRTAVERSHPASTLPFSLKVRAVLAGWNLLFFRPGPFAPDRERSPAWNCGAYLVEGLGHCGACHSPRNAFGAERSGQHLEGGMSEGWNAYALDRASPAPVPWTVDTLTFYLRHGWEATHGVSRGPMTLVTASLGIVPEDDVRAMAVYLVSLMGRSGIETVTTANGLQGDGRPPSPAASAGTQVAVAAAPDAGPGGTIYAGACASCHDSGRPVPYGGLALNLSSALHAPDPANIVTVVLHGLAPPHGAPGAIMPGFEGTLDDGQIAALLAYLRDDVAHEDAWSDLDGRVKAARRRAPALLASEGASTFPARTQVSP